MQQKKENDRVVSMQQNYNSLRILQKEHEELQECLRQNNHSLAIHAEMISKMDTSSMFTHLNKALVQQLFQKQTEVQNSYANMLLNGQIRVEQQIQFRNILEEYENRMTQLRTSMIDKEVQLAYEMNSKKREYTPTSQNLRIFNIGLIQERNIKNLIKQHNRLTQEVTAMEKQLKTNNHYTRDCTQDDHTQEKHRKTSSKIKNIEKNNPIYIHRLLQRVYTLLNDQINEEQRLKKQRKQAQQTYRALTEKHKDLVNEYKKSISDNKEDHGNKLKINDSLLNQVPISEPFIKNKFKKHKVQKNESIAYSQQVDDEQI